MKLFSVCPTCPKFEPKPYDGNRSWGDFDKCPTCGSVMEVWTESGVRNEQYRLGNRPNPGGLGAWQIG